MGKTEKKAALGRWLVIGIVAAALIAAVLSFVLLPDTLRIQFGTSAENPGLTVSRAAGVSVALGASLLGVILYRSGDRDVRYFALSALGLIGFLILFLVNL